ARVAVLGDDTLGDAGGLVHALFHRLAVDQVLEANGARLLGDDGQAERIPLGQAVAFLHGGAVLEHQHGAVGHAMDRTLAAFRVDHRHLAGAGERQAPATLVDDGRHVAVFDLAVGYRFEVAGLVDLRRAADVEGPHRQLRARLTDRLRRDHADRLADVDRRAARQIAPVALAAHALFGLADQRAADLGRLHFGFLDRLDHRFVEQ